MHLLTFIENVDTSKYQANGVQNLTRCLQNLALYYASCVVITTSTCDTPIFTFFLFIFTHFRKTALPTQGNALYKKFMAARVRFVACLATYNALAFALITNALSGCSNRTLDPVVKVALLHFGIYFQQY